MDEVMQEIRALALKYDLKVITTIQPRPLRNRYRPPEPYDGPIFIDYLGILR